MDVFPFLLSLFAFILAGTKLIITVVNMDESPDKGTISTCPKCSTSIIESYAFIMPRNRKCPYCGTKMKTYKA